MKRYFGFEAYRNIGFESDGTPKAEVLIINNSLKSDKLGSLLILIGANNSGKSNVLDGVCEFGENGPTERDCSDLFLDDKSQNPVLFLEAEDKDDIYFYKKYADGKEEIKYPEMDVFEIKNTNTDSFLADLNSLRNAEANYLGTSLFLSNTIEQPVSSDNIIRNLKKVFKSIEAVLSRNQGFVRYIKDNPIYKDYLLNDKNNITALNACFNKKYGFNFVPNIIKYEEKHITNDDLNTTPTTIENNAFFIKLLETIDYPINKVKRAYEFFNKQKKNKGPISHLVKEINPKLNEISDRFNKLYYESKPNNGYRFSLDCESEKIFFQMEKDGKNISLDNQSTGFKWFFDLFFNLLSSSTLSKGDVVVMDEPATHLHVRGIEEIREMLRAFAIKNNVTVIVATHSEHLINLDYLEDLRVVRNNECIAEICRSFTTVDKEDPDSLKAVKQSLTCDRYHILNPDYATVFVEGITDYDYLVGMKIIHGFNKIYFLPINGVGKNDTERKKIIDDLTNVSKKPILLVDNDAKGQEIKRYNANNGSKLKIVSLDDIDGSFTEIESLFDTNDLNKFGLVDGDKYVKSIPVAAAIKYLMINKSSEISSETKNRFKKVLDYLQSLFN